MPDLTKITQGIQTLELDADLANLRAAHPNDEGTSTGREFTGIGVPWDTVIEVWGMREAFAPGSVEPHPDGVLLCWRHDEPIGVVTAHRDVDAGWEVDGRLSQTARGEEVATLLRDEVITKLSVRFEPLEYRVERDEDTDTDTVIYTKAIVREVSLVPFPAYSTATVSNVRQQQPSKETHPMPENTTTQAPAELDELRASVDELGRRVELINTESTREEEPNPLHQFRSFGDFVKSIAAGDESATRAYEGVVSGDVLLSGNDHTWVGDVIKLVEARTPLTNFFNHTKDLPPTGMNVDYGILGTNTLRVAEQVNEGDDLVYGKISLADATARVRTIGGWTDMSRQSIERSGRNVVDLAFRGFAIAYANALEAIAASVFGTAYAAQLALGDDAIVTVDADPAALTADNVIDLLVDLAIRYQTSTYNLDALLVAPDLFKALAKVDEDKKLLQITGSPTDKAGTLSLSSVEANLSNVRVAPWAGAPTTTSAVAVDAQAVKVQESPGAPFRLQDENIINLTKQFSVYGYVAAYSEMPEGIVPITFDAGV